MSTPAPNPKLDNLFGICHALGETFGVNPLVLRLLFTIGALANFEAAVIVYAAGGVAVLVGTLIARFTKRPARRRIPAIA